MRFLFNILSINCSLIYEDEKKQLGQWNSFDLCIIQLTPTIFYQSSAYLKEHKIVTFLINCSQLFYFDLCFIQLLNWLSQYSINQVPTSGTYVRLNSSYLTLTIFTNQLSTSGTSRANTLHNAALLVAIVIVYLVWKTFSSSKISVYTWFNTYFLKKLS